MSIDNSLDNLHVIATEIDDCELTIPKKLINDEEEDEIDDIECGDELEEEVSKRCETGEEGDEIKFPENCENLRHGYLKIKDTNHSSREILMRKSTYVWHLHEGSKKISSDRLIRVQDTTVVDLNQRMSVESGSNITTSVFNKKVNVFQYIKIGDWCCFKNGTNGFPENIFIGQLLAFKYARGRSANEKRYKGDMVNLREFGNRTLQRNPQANELEVLSTWYFGAKRESLFY